MACGLDGHIDVLDRVYRRRLWASAQGLLRGPRLGLPLLLGHYNLYRGTSGGSIDYDAPTGQAAAGQDTVIEWAGTQPPGSAAYDYGLLGMGPGGVETAAASTAIYTVSYAGDQTRTAPSPAKPTAVTVAARAAGEFELVVTIDGTTGDVAPASLAIAYDVGGGWVALTAQAIGPGPVQTVHVVRDPGQAHGTTVTWGVACVSAEGASSGYYTPAPTAVVDDEGPAAVSGLAASCT